MRIAYLLHWNDGPASGVFKKVLGQASRWQSARHEVRLFLCAKQDSPPLEGRGDGSVLRVDTVHYPSAPKRLRQMQRLAQMIDDWRPDLIYYRYDVYYPAVARLAKRFPTVTEINTDDVEEYRLGSPLRRWYNLLTRGFLFRHVCGMVFVTRELSRRRRFQRFRKPSLVIGNGIALDHYAPLPPADNPSPALAFMGSPWQPWHGVDRIARLAREFPDWHFDLIGVDAAEIEPSAPNLAVHGFRQQSDYVPILARADLAIGTLALERKGLAEATPLKVREYLAFGLPVITAYDDTDFPDPVPFLLRLNIAGAAAGSQAAAGGRPARKGGATPRHPADDIPMLEFSRVRAFAQEWKGRRVPRAAIVHLDSAVKEHRRLGFFAACIAARAA